MITAETDARRRAFDLIPQLPTDTTVAREVLRYALAISSLATSLGGDDRNLALDLVHSLMSGSHDAQRVLESAVRIWDSAMEPEKIEAFVEMACPGVGRLRIVGEGK